MAPAPLAPARHPDLLLDGLALLITEGYAAGTPALRRALLAFRGQDISAEQGLSWLWLAGLAAMAVWDDETWHILASRHVKLARDAGALSELPLAVRWRILLHTHAGELEQGAALIAEAQAVADATGSQLGPGALGVAAWRGREAEATELIQATMNGMTSRGEGRGVTSQYAARLAVQRPRPLRQGPRRRRTGVRVRRRGRPVQSALQVRSAVLSAQVMLSVRGSRPLVMRTSSVRFRRQLTGPRGSGRVLPGSIRTARGTEIPVSVRRSTQDHCNR